MSRTTKLVSRMKGSFKNTLTRTRKALQIVRRPTVAIAGTVVIGAAAAAGYVLLQDGGFKWSPMAAARDVARDATQVLMPEKSVAQLLEVTKANPKDGDAFMSLGDAQFKAGERGAALHSYSRAMALKAEPSDQMVTNLPLLFGTNLQDASAAILMQYNVTAAAEGLHAASSHPEYQTRWEALKVLQKLKRAEQKDYVHAWMQDLNESRCAVQQNAVENLGRHGDSRALRAIRAADERDEKNTPWFGITCLGDRPEEAEKMLLGKRPSAKPVLAKK